MAATTATPPVPGEGLALHGVGVRFGGLVALDDVSLRVRPGQVVGVIGPNGAGKTTLFNVICGFVRPAAGSLTLRGQPLRPRPDRLTRLGIARTLQGVGLFAGLTVAENVMAGATGSARAGFLPALLGLRRSDHDERRLRAEALDLLDELGVAGHADALPTTLPYGVRKRVALARALAARPQLLLLDEPAGGLGVEEIAELGELIGGLPRRAGRRAGAGGDEACSVLLVEHHMDLVMSVCDQIVVLDFGRVIATGTPEQIRDNPAVTDAYLGVDEPSEPDITASTKEDSAEATA